MSYSSLILASSSPFRKELLSRLHLPFETISPDIDETILADENVEQYVRRLSLEKAQVIANDYPDAIIIGSDQSAYLDGRILGKPGTHENAVKQLQQSCGKEVVFYTGLSVVHQASRFCEVDCVKYHVGFRALSDQQIENYLITEQPYNCAGSFKSEGYGISLFSYMSGDDPTSIVGLPLIRLVAMLEAAGVQVV